ncbi:MAG: 50S ribosomal protein L17 [Planctomycetes bacterium]|nr:50S ribosomal protein L17 [Planctomycetota bacterium]
MRHRKRTWKLGRNAAHRKATRRNLVAALFRHERIVTTVPKAKAFRPFAERMITLAKEKDLPRYRRAISLLGDLDAVRKLFDVLGPRFKARPGGYTRIVRLPERRLGDDGRLAIFELVERTPKEKPAPEGKKGAAEKKGAKEKAAAKKTEKKAAAAAS